MNRGFATDAEFAFDTFGGAQNALCLAPDAPRAVVGVLPAVGIRAAYYTEFFAALNARGIAGVAADWIGAGASPVRASRRVAWSYNEMVHQHAAGLHDASQKRFGDVPFFWLGHSLGGHVAMLHAGLESGVRGVALFASGSPHYKAWTGRERVAMAGGSLMVRVISAALGHFPGKELRFGERESAAWARDWYHVHRTGSFSHPGFDGDALLRQMRAPVLVATVFDDRLAPGESAAALVARTPTSNVTRRSWNPGHAVGHNRWPRRLRERAAEDFDLWVSRILSSA
ncbi:MAG: alpha/beta fold hydrolase [Polyangiales bacterium]